MVATDKRPSRSVMNLNLECLTRFWLTVVCAPRSFDKLPFNPSAEYFDADSGESWTERARLTRQPTRSLTHSPSIRLPSALTPVLTTLSTAPRSFPLDGTTHNVLRAFP